MVAIIASELIFGLLSIWMNSSIQKLQEAYSRSDAFRKHFDELYNLINEEYQSKINDSTPTSSGSINQKEFVENLMYQKFGRTLLQLRKEFDEIQTKYDDAIYKTSSANQVNKLTNQESLEKQLAINKVKEEGNKLSTDSHKLEIYSRRPSSYRMMAQKKGKE